LNGNTIHERSDQVDTATSGGQVIVLSGLSPLKRPVVLDSHRHIVDGAIDLDLDSVFFAFWGAMLDGIRGSFAYGDLDGEGRLLIELTCIGSIFCQASDRAQALTLATKDPGAIVSRDAQV